MSTEELSNLAAEALDMFKQNADACPKAQRFRVKGL